MNRIADPPSIWLHRANSYFTAVAYESYLSELHPHSSPTRLSLLLLIGYLCRSSHFATQMTAMWYPHSQAAYEWQMGETATHGWTSFHMGRACNCKTLSSVSIP